MQWVCDICGFVHEEEEPPEICPVCGAPASKFTENSGSWEEDEGAVEDEEIVDEDIDGDVDEDEDQDQDEDDEEDGYYDEDDFDEYLDEEDEDR